jgi:hypothetical protein
MPTLSSFSFPRSRVGMHTEPKHRHNTKQNNNHNITNMEVPMIYAHILVILVPTLPRGNAYGA